jgi:short-subunit dehydrogenase
MRKLIVVTGGSKGIGKAIIEKFASQQFDIVTCARKNEDLQKMKAEVEEKFPGASIFCKSADMSDKNQVKEFTDFVAHLNREVDVLVNNAGHFIPGEITTEREGTLESMINANVYSAYYTTRGLVEKMKKRRTGHIFNICSIASIKAYANGGSYAISKFAMLGFSKCLREELKECNIRVTAVMPGATKTQSWEGVNLPDDRFMKVEDVAETVFSVYSLSKRSVVEEIIIRPQLGDI